MVRWEIQYGIMVEIEQYTYLGVTLRGEPNDKSNEIIWEWSNLMQVGQKVNT